jgi:stage V sporulation protein R
VRAALLQTVAGNMIPTIYVDKVIKDNTLYLRHEHDGRDLELDYADNCVKLLKNIWHGPVKLFTEVEDEEFEIS